MARQRGWPIPVYSKKPQSDANYERLSRRMLEAHEQIYSAFGTHNVRSMAISSPARTKASGSTPTLTKSRCFTGWPSPSKRRWCNWATGCANIARSARCCPAWRTSCAACSKTRPTKVSLKAKFTTQVASKELLRDPLDLCSLDEPAPESKLPEIPADSSDLLPPALGEAVDGARTATDGHDPSEPRFSHERNPSPTNRPPISRSKKPASQMREALAAERAAFGKDYPLVIGGKTPTGDQWIDSVNPAKPSEEKLGRVVAATREQAQAAVEAAVAAAPGWRATSADKRAAILDKMAEPDA